MQGTVLCRRGRNPAEKACRDFSLARSLFSTQRVPAEPLGRRGRHRPAPAPKRHPLPCRYAGQSRSRALRTPTVAAFPSPAGALARRCRSTGAVRGQKLGLPPGSAAWQRGYGHARRGCAQRAGSVPRSACRWVTETGTKTAVQSGLEDGGGGDGTHTHRGAPAAGRAVPAGFPTRLRCRGNHRHPGLRENRRLPLSRATEGTPCVCVCVPPARRARGRLSPPSPGLLRRAPTAAPLPAARHGRDRLGSARSRIQPVAVGGFLLSSPPPPPSPAAFTTSAMNNPPLRSP